MDYLILVNKQNKIPDNWESNIQFETVKNVWEKNTQIEKEALKQFIRLKQDLAKEDVFIELDSAYRSIKKQEELMAKFEHEYGSEYTKKTVAIPGTSEHHTGLAIDVCLRKDGKLIYENEEMLKEKQIWNIVHTKMPNYGFILRYPKGKEKITGYSYEPWHIRYVGIPKIASYLTSQNLTLEEYQEQTK